MLDLYSSRWDPLGTELVFRRAVFCHYPCQLFRPQRRPQREKFMPARRASQRSQSQPASYSRGYSRNFPRGDPLQFQVPANATSRI